MSAPQSHQPWIDCARPRRAMGWPAWTAPGEVLVRPTPLPARAAMPNSSRRDPCCTSRPGCINASNARTRTTPRNSSRASSSAAANASMPATPVVQHGIACAARKATNGPPKGERSSRAPGARAVPVGKGEHTPTAWHGCRPRSPMVANACRDRSKSNAPETARGSRCRADRRRADGPQSRFGLGVRSGAGSAEPGPLGARRETLLRCLVRAALVLRALHGHRRGHRVVGEWHRHLPRWGWAIPLFVDTAGSPPDDVPPPRPSAI